MKAVNTTVKSTISILAAMSFVVACGSKKNNPADGVVGPNAVKTIEGEFKAEGVKCTDGEVTEGNAVVGTMLKLFKVGEEGRYTEIGTVAGPQQIRNGQFEITDGDTAKGKIKFVKFVYAEGSETGTPSEDVNDLYYTDFTLSGDDLTLTHRDGSVCKDGLAVKSFKRNTAPVATAPETKPADAAPTAEGNGQTETLPATPAAPAPVEGEKK